MPDCKSFSLAAGILLFFAERAFATAPLQYLTSSGVKADPVVGLTWGVTAISLVVIVIVAALLAFAIWRRPGLPLAIGARTELAAAEGGRSWLWIGVGISSLVLLFTVVWTVVVLAKVLAPPIPPAVTIEITGKQWWWQVTYLSPDPSRVFTTANEIHIPAGQPVRLKLIGGDVIHSFWVPQLAGKMDAIPGLTNETWMQAKRPGLYSGQCTEYCGVQHAHMGIVMIADTPADFRSWWDHQLLAARGAPGETAFLAHCGGCHTVRGTEAAGVLGPDLSHLMSRGTLAAGLLRNDAPTLARWISDPQSLKPGALMQAPQISATDRDRIDSYLRTLK